ncbi:1-acyl-sn-glycerol-3-phosphate acyltransferase [Pasteurellaceae bacterium UScroc12]|nr:1-acyl-sn-glycerol-3-phosphate acyltransferase [Pasteurellaceae bacterium UScroc12]
MYRSIAVLLGVKIEILGKENIPNKSCIFIANHQSNYDIFFVTNAVPKKTIAIGKKSILYFPLFGLIYWLGGNILIDRNDKPDSIKKLNSLEKKMNMENIFVWFFPEGTRNYGKKLLPFKKGAFHIANNIDCPIVPVCISSYYSKFNINRFNNGKIIIKYLPPEKIHPPIKAHIDTLHSRMETEISNLDTLLSNSV